MTRLPVFAVVGRAAPIDSSAWEQRCDRVHDLHDRADVCRLITRSPQADETRCAGAALFNAFLFDGDAVANARAIDCTATKRDVPLSDTERWALASMRAHHLTPHEAATLHDTLFRIADSFQGELAATLAALRALGGYPNTSAAHFRMERMGLNSFHWSVTSTSPSGTAHADSSPQPSGKPSATEFHHAGRFMHAFIADVTMSATLEGTTLRTRTIQGKPGDVLPTAIVSRALFLANGRVRKGPVERLDPANGEPVRSALGTSKLRADHRGRTCAPTLF